MARRDTPWPPGTPCWVDLMTTDPEAARTFYGDLFGWQYEVGGPETGHYAMAKIDGGSVCGIGAAPPGMEHPSAWTSYLASADADATSAAITAAGGAVVQPTIDVMGFGRMVIARDPTGAVFGVWQAGTSIGSEVTNESGALVWNELMTSDYADAQRFYTAAFGVTFTEIGGGNFQFSTMEVEGSTVGGIGVPTDTLPQMPAYWRHYFAAADTDAVVAAALNAGGRVVTDAHDSPFGRWAMLADPQGAAFCVITPPAPS